MAARTGAPPSPSPAAAASSTASEPLYLDHNASTPVPARVREVAARALAEGFGNPSADHAWGRRARAFVDEARAQVAALLGCAADEIVFTGGGTEANNLAIAGAVRALAAGPGTGRSPAIPPGGSPSNLRIAIVTTAVEHPATLAPVRALEGAGARVRIVAPGPDGAVTAEAVEAAIPRGEPALVTVMLAQNETGVLQPVAEIARRARALGALVHTDAAQAVGKIPVDVGALGVDLLSVAGHKLYAPKGVGALYVRRGTPLAPFLLGAGHERGLRPGTENVSGIAALGEACAMAREDLEAEAERQRGLTTRMTALLSAEGFVVHGAAASRLPNTLNGRFPGVRGSALLAAVPELAFTTGSACHAGEESPSAVLLAMGLAPSEALGAVRLSLGRGTTADDVERAASLLVAAARRLR